jgi:thiol-disulfide isomerase/thioredoxin
MNNPWQKYVLAFLITAAIFGTSFYIVQRIDAQRIADIRATEESISIDILSSETQFDLLGSLDCKTIAENPVLSDQLNSLASRLSIAEQNLGSTNKEVVQLKQQYSLLEIKDYLLLQQIAQKCKLKPVFVLYFYSNQGDCPDCSRTGEELSYLRQKYPGLRVYSFDYNLDLSALRTLMALQKLSGPLPAFIINNRAPVYGFKTLDELQTLMPELKDLATTSAATSTAQH